MILEWSRIPGHEVFPIFYDVDPSDVRKHKGSIGKAFSLHEKEIMDAETDPEIKQKLMEKLKRWRDEEIAKISGKVLKNETDGHEAKFIEHIVDEIRIKLKKKVLYVGPYLVGMGWRIRSIDSWVKNSLSSEDILVISGMGGIGKTTIAKYIYNLNFQHFEATSFLASVKDESGDPRGLVELQKQLLSSILKGKKEEPYNVDQGIIMIKEAICCRRILLVIDDVDEVKQLDALLGTREFHQGSKIIITTRNKSLLKAYEAHKLHEVKELSDEESFELFCWHAFGNEKPDEGYEELSDACDFYSECGIQKLLDRFILSIGQDKRLEMHQLIREMGWQIVDDESRKDPGRHSRVWRPKDSLRVLKENKVLYEFGIYSTYVLFEEIPRSSIDGSYSGSSSVSFVVPSHHTLRLRGINVYCVYDYHHDDDLGNDFKGIFIKISNKTKDLCWVYLPVIVGYTENEEDKLVYLRHWMFGSQLESSDEVEVSTSISYWNSKADPGNQQCRSTIKEVHVKLVWCQEEIPINATGIVGGDLLSFHFLNEREFILGQVHVIDNAFRSRKSSHGYYSTEEDINKWINQRRRKQITRPS